MENINWFGHASFSFVDENGNRIYYVDPFDLKPQNLEKADLIFITHAHPDHFSPSDIQRIITDETVIIAPPDILEKIDISEDRKLVVEPNVEYEVKEFKFQTFPAYNNHPEKLQFHPKENNWVGYIFELNGKKVYHAGDTDFIPEMKDLASLKLYIAMLPIGGHYTMEEKEAAAAANVIKAEFTIPMHYKVHTKERTPEVEESFKKLVTESEVIILEELK